MKIYSLKEHYELRNTRSLRLRQGIGRYFCHKDRPGFLDGSGAVWPVKIEPETLKNELKPGCVYRFAVTGNGVQQNRVSKYRDHETLLIFSDLNLESGDETETWELTDLPDPRSLPVFQGTESATHGTFFFQSLTSKRIESIAQRSFGLQKARTYFLTRSYIELDPPQLVLSGGVERYLNTFKTDYCDHRGQSWTMELPTSPEFSLKKIIAEGCPKVFALSHSFRNNGELSKHHEPEFMMLEWYRLGADFASLLAETQGLISEIASGLQGAISLPNNSWPIFRVPDLFMQILNLDLSECSDVEIFRHKASSLCRSVVDSDTWDDLFCKLFMEFIEPFLEKQIACFVTHYPAQMGALAARNDELPGTVDRFEAYVLGVEICNGYRELIDESEYKTRTDTVIAERSDVVVDPMFSRVMRVGLYPCVGNALGLDRLIAVLRGDKNIKATLPWPFLSRFPKSTVACE